MIDAAAVERLRDTLRAGGVALVPTDTVYGLAAALDVPEGVDALYRLKGRPHTQPCQVLLLGVGLLDEALGPLDPRIAAAVRALLPGTTTCLVDDPAGRYVAAAGAQPGSVGLRVPAMEGPLASLDLPLVATSANDPGGRDPAAVGDVPEEIRDGVAAILDAGRLPGTASTVVDLRPVAGGGPARVMRAGAGCDEVAARLRRLGIPVEPG